MAWLFWASAWAAVAARVTTPVVISAMSGGAAAVPAPDTVTVESRRGIPSGPAIGAHADEREGEQSSRVPHRHQSDPIMNRSSSSSLARSREMRKRSRLR